MPIRYFLKQLLLPPGILILLLVLALWLRRSRPRVAGVLFALGLGGFWLMSLPPLFPGSMLQMQHQSSAFGWHIAVAVLAYSTLTIAAFHAILMALQESRLHTRSAKAGFLGSALDQLPALLTMEKLLFREHDARQDRQTE